MKRMTVSVPTFSLSFLLVGLPIIFAVREYIPISKFFLTYSFIGILLISLINVKNLFSLKFYSDKPFAINLLLFSLLIMMSIFYIFSDAVLIHLSEAIYIFITIFVFIALTTRRVNEFISFPYYIMVISSFSTVLTLLTTPLSSDFWSSYGGRLYVGDTNNPNLSSFIALINVLSIIFYFSTKSGQVKKSIQILLLLILSGSLYIYFLSFSKSALIGFILALSIFLPSNFFKSKRFFKGLAAVLALTFLSFIFFPELATKLVDKAAILTHAFNSYFFGEYTNLAADSAAIRHENLNNVFNLLPQLGLFYGNGIFTTRADFPPLQVFTDLGIFIGVLNLFLMIIIPFYILLKQRFILKTYKNEPLYPLYLMSVIVFLFYLPNLFFHGTPYEFNIWLPILILYKFAPWKKRVVSNA